MMRRTHGWAVVAVVAVLGLAACGGGGNPGGGNASHPIGDRAIRAVEVVARAGVFQEPLDAAPSPDGRVIYFVATGDHGPAVFSVPGSGGAEPLVTDGAPLAKPTGVGVATDGQRIYVADQEARPAQAPTATAAAGAPGSSAPATSAPATSAAAAAGAILTVRTTTSAGGLTAPTVLPGTVGRAPRGLDVVNQGDANVIYFTGTDPGDGKPGLFQVSSDGGTVLTIAEGAPFTSPDSVVVSAQGVAYVTDQGAGPGQGQVFRVSGGTVMPVLTGLHLGAPAGVTLVNNDATLLVSSIDGATLSDQVLFLDLATGTTAAATKVIGANKNSSGGLHRAHNATDLAWADIQGQVYRVRLGGGPGLR